MSKDYRIVFSIGLVTERWDLEPKQRDWKIELLLTARAEMDEDDLMEQVIYSIRRPKEPLFNAEKPRKLLKHIEDNIWRDVEKGILESVKANLLTEYKDED